MYRRAYVTLIGVAGTMGLLALLVSIRYDQPLLDPEGKFLGPSWARLPLLLVGALLLDLLPRTLWYSKLKPKAMWPIVKERWNTHWNRERITLVVLGVVSFYVTYVSYRNLKSQLPFVRSTTDPINGDQVAVSYDRELYLLDKALFFGHNPGDVLHNVLGTQIVAFPLSSIYLAFLPLVPLSVTAWMVWSRNLSFGYWYVTSQCIAWTLGTASYYALPTLGPVFERPAGYTDLAHTPTTDLVDSLNEGRKALRLGDYNGQGVEGIVNSVAGFASLHTRDHAAGGADGAVHAALEGVEVDLLGQLRPHRARHHLLRVALPGRRHRRGDDRVRVVLPRRDRHRATLRPLLAALPSDHHDVVGAGARGMTLL